MGKGLITENVGNGLYKVQIVKNTMPITKKIEGIVTRVNIINTNILPELNSQLFTAETEMNLARVALDNAIEAYRLGTITSDEVVLATREYSQRVKIWTEISRQIDHRNYEIESLESEKEYLEDSIPTQIEYAWCADKTTDLTGNVGTIEIPGEIGRVMIQPGNDGNAVYSSTRDGLIQPVMASSPAQSFFNHAIFPGWQKWMPTYRIGTITSWGEAYGGAFYYYGFYDTDKLTIYLDCVVGLDPIYSSAQNLNINYTNTLTHVKFDYMNLGYTFPSEWYFVPPRVDWPNNIIPIRYRENYFGMPSGYQSLGFLPFDIGDRVVVKFTNQDRNLPVIIGFETNPKNIHLKLHLFYFLWNFAWKTPFPTNANLDQIADESMVYSIHAYKAFLDDYGEIVDPYYYEYDISYVFNQKTKYWEITINESFVLGEVCCIEVWYEGYDGEWPTLYTLQYGFVPAIYRVPLWIYVEP